MNVLERSLAVVAPRLALNRMQYRMAMRHLESQEQRQRQGRERRYDAASKGRRASKWRNDATSANAETAAASTIRNRARDLERNNAYAAKALTSIVSNVIGTGIQAQVKGGKGAKRRADKAHALWVSWAETTACDWDGAHDLYGLQALVMRTVVRDGEALVRFRWENDGEFPLKLQVLEADFLDSTKQSGENGNDVIQGVEVDSNGRVVAYWLHSHHPGDGLFGWFRRKLHGSQRVPADQVARIFRRERAGQLRGVSWFAPIMAPLRDLDEYEDAQLTRQKIASCFTVFVTDPNADEAEAGGDEDENGTPLEKVEPGIIEYLGPGKDVRFPNPPSVEGFGDFVRAVLRKVASGIGLTYETLTGDLTQTNFSGGRMSWIEQGRNIESWQWQLIIPQLCVPVARQFKRGADIVGLDMAGLEVDWTAPRRELINPKEEIAAMVAEVRAGFKSWSEVLRERGYDPATVMAQIAADAELFDKYGLIFDSDPRRTTQQGQPRDKALPSKGADASASAA